MLSEISQTQKDKNHMTSLTCGIKTPPPSSSQRKTGVCQRQGVSKMGEGGQNGQVSCYKINKSRKCNVQGGN